MSEAIFTAKAGNPAAARAEAAQYDAWFRHQAQTGPNATRAGEWMTSGKVKTDAET
ncbi:MAG: hypothetical protein LBI87_01770 [Candidatus Accumulibacter sp.]|jgi:hypothetical protein|nr:hypothetical protein [Accumulibacter sp.]